MKYEDTCAGTMTKTNVRAEHPDEDRSFSPFGLIPPETIPLSGTKTHTRIKAEGPSDEDLGGQQSRVIPSCFSS
jgi:hypothetical protein